MATSSIADDSLPSLLCAIDEAGNVIAPEWVPSDAVLLRMLREMLRIRALDELMVRKQRQGKIGFYGAVTGQEAVPVAAALAASPEDWFFPALRESATMLVRGFPLARWLAQVYGNEADLLHGRQMPCHMSSRQVRQVSWSSCIATQLPHAVGAAMAARARGHSNVSLAFLGDGATSEGDFHSAMNFAAVFNAAVVFVCQNNHWAISLPTSSQTAAPTLAAKASAYGMAALRVDGNDVVMVHRVIADALSRAREGGGPTLIEAVTYRMGPHSSSDDPTRYRSEVEIALWKARDPIARLTRLLTDRGALSASALSGLESAIAAELAQAVEAVETLGPPARQSLFEDVFAKPPWHIRQQAAEHEQAWQTRVTTSS